MNSEVDFTELRERMGAVAAEQVSYTHSGEVLPGGRVVGYASVIVTRDR